jgi:ABC-type thiamin/hydroxymethylpyrimidine transport system permease subunit
MMEKCYILLHYKNYEIYSIIECDFHFGLAQHMMYTGLAWQYKENHVVMLDGMIVKSGIFYNSLFTYIYLFFVEWQFLLLFYSFEHVKQQYI